MYAPGSMKVRRYCQAAVPHQRCIQLPRACTNDVRRCPPPAPLLPPFPVFYRRTSAASTDPRPPPCGGIALPSSRYLRYLGPNQPACSNGECTTSVGGG